MSSPKKLIISDEVKDEYKSECWDVYGGSDLVIYVKCTPTKALDIAKWNVLMRKVASASSVCLGADEVGLDDKKSFNNRFFPPFCEALKNNTTITTLEFFSDVINHVGMKSICNVLQTHTTITYVRIWCEHFSHSIGRDLEEMIKVNNTLAWLSVHVSAEDVKCFARALPHNSTLTELDLAKCGRSMGNEGLRRLCDGLRGNHSITKIDLSNNGISNEGSKDLCSLLEVNHSITSVDLGYNDITSLPQDFAFLTHINSLSLYGNTNLLFPPQHVTNEYQIGLFEFFADFRYGRMKFHFLLGFHERVGNHTSIQSYLDHSSIFEPNLLSCIFEFLS